MEGLKRVILYTDGACIGNPGPGGYGIVLVYGTHRREMSGGFRLTTNNRMELMAALVGLQALKEKCEVTLYSDSEYLVKAMSEGWPKKWSKNAWMRNKKKRALNPDPWERLLQLCESHQVDFKWVKGHIGIADNECCDRLAIEAAEKVNLPADAGYANNHSEETFEEAKPLLVTLSPSP